MIGEYLIFVPYDPEIIYVPYVEATGNQVILLG